MTMKRTLGQVSFTLTYLLLYFISLNDAQPEGFIDYPTSVSNVLSLMGKYGLKQIKAEGRANTKQYLVTTLLTAEELDEASVWEMDKLLALGKDRLKIFYNQNVAGADELETKGGPRHGEIIFIYFGEHNSVDALIERLPVKGDDSVPGHSYLIFYSYYIPCACIPYCSFNCAEELGKFARLHTKDMTTIVGYSAVYAQTDEQSAEVFLKEGGVSLFRDTTGNNDDFQLVQVITDTNRRPMKGTFQELFQQCLISSPVSICIPDETKERIVIAFINYIMLPNFKASIFFGRLSEMSKFFLRKEVKRKLEESIRKVSCDKMLLDPENCRSLINKCSDSALDQTDILAYPTFGATRFYKPIEDDMRWRDVEALSRNFGIQYVSVPDCEKKFHSVTSLCISKAEKKGKKGTNTLPDRTGREFNDEEEGRLTGTSGLKQETGQVKQKQGASTRTKM
ncbi:uncharacterized protein LOC128240898 [Mya arenaria]|uniref:uncharacterized protein LOC128240898 n=1 Tax=Mya arenaria TaxID=6604 RepID=UPI0022E771A3|nr:uncharacterized protein LOC128240898 [Mya arenaria]